MVDLLTTLRGGTGTHAEAPGRRHAMTRSGQVPIIRRRGRRRPNLSGDLGQLLSHAPCFRSRLAGYDRLQVENYVSWAESELELAGRQLDELARRLGECSAALQQAEQRLATSPAGWELGRVSERVGEILRLAADEAADLVQAGTVAGERLRAQGGDAAAAVLRVAHALRARAGADSDRLRELTESAHRMAEVELRQVRAQAAALLLASVSQHAGAVAERAEAHRVAAHELEVAHAELALAHLRRVQAEDVVARLSGELETALGGLVPAPAVLAVVPASPVAELPRTDAARVRSAS
jgi:DNA repair exonuclease SbcCD ATPase subunit